MPELNYLNLGGVIIEQRDIADVAYLAVRDVCEALGLDVEFWNEALQDADWAVVGQTLDGRWYITLLTLPVWVRHISPHVVPPEKLETFRAVLLDATEAQQKIVDNLRERLQA